MDITAILVGYNHALYATEALNAVTAQVQQPAQIIVTDDASTDRTVSVVDAWAAGRAVQRVTHRENQGLLQTLNEALDLVTSPNIALCSLDDAWRPQHLAALGEALKRHPKAVMAYGDAEVIDGSGVTINPSFFAHYQAPNPLPTGDIFPDLLQRNFLPAMAVVARTEAVRAAGGFDESLSYEDWDLWLRLAAIGEAVAVPQVIANYRVLATGLMQTLLRGDAYVDSTVRLRLKQLGVRPELDDAILGYTRSELLPLYAAGDARAPRLLEELAVAGGVPRDRFMAAAARRGVPFHWADRMLQRVVAVRRTLSESVGSQHGS